MRAREFIIEGYPEAQAEFAQASGDAGMSKQVIDQFRSLVNKNQVQGDERNIDWWRKQGWESFSKFVTQKSEQPTKTQVKRQRVAGKSITLMESDKWLIVIPLDKDASCFHGKNSDWCTTKPHQPYFENYFYDRNVTLIYCLNKQTGGMWAIAAHKDLEGKFEIFDQQDRSMTEEGFFGQTQLSARKIIEVALDDKNQPEVQQARVTYNESVQLTKDLLEQFQYGTGQMGKEKARSPEIEKHLLYNKNQELCAEYIMALIGSDLENWNPGFTQFKRMRYRFAPDFIPEGIILPALQRRGSLISLIKDPNERMQLAAVHEDGYNIQWIKNSTLKAQIECIQEQEGAAYYIQNVNPELFKKYPELADMYRFIPEKVWNHILPQVAEYIRQEADEQIFEMEQEDDSWREWQAEQAIELGYVDDEGDIDWERVHDDDRLNNYLEYSPDAEDFFSDVRHFIDDLLDPQTVIDWSEQYADDNGLEPSEVSIERLDRVLAWKLNRLAKSYLAKRVLDMLHVSEQHTFSGGNPQAEKPMPRVRWDKS